MKTRPAQSNWKLTPESVAEVLRRIAKGEKHVSISRDLGVNESTISRIYRGKAWREVGRPVMGEPTEGETNA